MNVEAELGDIQQINPILLICTNKVPQVFLQHTIEPLCLSITLRMIAGGHVEFGHQNVKQLGPKLPNEPSIPVAYNVLRHTPKLHHMLKEKLGSLCRIGTLCSRNEGSIL